MLKELQEQSNATNVKTKIQEMFNVKEILSWGKDVAFKVIRPYGYDEQCDTILVDGEVVYYFSCHGELLDYIAL